MRGDRRKKEKERGANPSNFTPTLCCAKNLHVDVFKNALISLAENFLCYLLTANKDHDQLYLTILYIVI